MEAAEYYNKATKDAQKTQMLIKDEALVDSSCISEFSKGFIPETSLAKAMERRTVKERQKRTIKSKEKIFELKIFGLKLFTIKY